jgi:flagellar hook-associated protein 2
MLDCFSEGVMGTVGLSFGSPTSGQGFDVSSTVASIVGNLKNVETPWSTQLTALESQDTAISSLGTLFSKLSNDMSSLTDFQGILSEKTGSSSDTNVLSLTAANSTAVAGTHTVEVTSLATTSSGYLAEIPDAADTLSGSIKLQVGSGAAQTISVPTTSGKSTLAGLAAAINASGVGINASVLTDSSGSRLSLVSITSGKSGNITVTANQIIDTTNHLGYTGLVGTDGTGGTSSTTSTGVLTGITNTADALSGSISIEAGSGAPIVIDLTSTDNTLSKLATAINGVANLGVQANVISNGDGTSSLQLVSNTPGSAGTLAVTSSIVDTTAAAATSLGYTSPVSGADAVLAVDGVNLTSSSNTVANLIPGVTFQLLAPSTKESDGSLEQIQVVIGNDNTDVESTVNSFVSDYNSLIGAMNTQEGNDASGSPEPLFGSPTLSLLQQQLMNGINAANPNGSLDSVTANTGTTLSGSMTLSIGGGTVENVVIGADPDPSSPAANTIYTGSGVNTLSGLASFISSANLGVAANVVTSNGASTLTLTSQTAGSAGAVSVTSDLVATSDTPVSFQGAQITGGTLSGVGSLTDPFTGTFNLNMGNGSTTLDIPLGSPTNVNGKGTTTVTTITDLENYINDSNFGVTASIVTSGTGANTTYGLSVLSNSSEQLAVTANVFDAYASANPLTFTTSSQTSGGAFSTVAAAGDVLTGSVSIQVAGGSAQTFSPPFTSDTTAGSTLAGLASAINAANMGVTATVVTNSDGTTQGLSLLSGTPGSSGTLAVTSTLLDSTNQVTSTLNYANSSDINSLTGLGISVNNDGSLTLDATSLDSVLNSNYSSVVGFFQNVDSWGQTFSNMLTNAGTTSGTGILALSSSSNSNIESTLNADISKENMYISAQQASLTNELNSANEIMQQLPSQLDGVNELYSAITGYNQQSNG